jgi:ParB/RepB/Spo0J family partition protein
MVLYNFPRDYGGQLEMPDFRKIPVALLIRPENPDRVESYAQSIEELAQDIQQNGLLNPICVRPTTDGSYQIIAGDRRGLAVTMLKWQEVDCKVFYEGEGNDEDIKASENLMRNPLSDVEEALAYKRRLPFEPNGTISMSLRLHVPQSRIENLLSLVDGDPKTLEYLAAKKISVAQALEINRFDTPTYRMLALEQAAHHGLKAEGLRRWRMDVKHGGGEQQVQDIIANLHAMAPAPAEEPMQVCHIGNHPAPLRLSKHYVICSEHYDMFLRGLEALHREEEARNNGRREQVVQHPGHAGDV